MRTASLLLEIQNGCHFTLKVRAELVEQAFDVDRSAPNDAARLFYRLLWRLASPSREELTFLLTQSEAPKRAERAHFLTDLRPRGERGDPNNAIDHFRYAPTRPEDRH